MKREEHVILVAVSVTIEDGGTSREQAEKALHVRLNTPGFRTPNSSTYVDSWWIAEDDRRDGSDCGSAVFIPGDGSDPDRLTQRQASAVLNIADRMNRDGVDPAAALSAMSDKTIHAAALSFLRGEDWDQDGLRRLAAALFIDPDDVEALTPKKRRWFDGVAAPLGPEEDDEEEEEYDDIL